MERTVLSVLLLVLVAVGCGEGGPPTVEGEPRAPSPTAEATGGLEGTLRLYTSVTQDTVDAVVAAFADEHPEVEVEVFRAPTGELSARIATEQREGGIRADVLWLTDPLSMFTYEAEGALQEWTPERVAAVPAEYAEATFWGTRILNLVIVHPADADDPPASWRDLTAVDGNVAIPDPGFAGSAFGALAFFGLDERFGFEWYEDLERAGLVQVQAPGDVVTGVAEGRFAAGMTLDKVARDAIDEGSPIEMVFPEPGAVAIYSPIAVVEGTTARAAAEAFVDFTLGPEAQEAIANTGWQPIRDDVDWEHEGAQVAPDWEAAFDEQEELLERYRAIVGG